MLGFAKITFCGGTGSVTGANFLLEIDDKKILIDCGLTQGMQLAEDVNWVPFPYNPEEIDILFITHAHIDHIGRIPKLINEGFNGKIYSTKPTRLLSGPMLEDTAGILSKNKLFNLNKIYSEENIKKAFLRWLSFDYKEKIRITENLEVSFKNAGHILGSAMVEFVYRGKKILFTGDLGNSPSPLLPDTDKITDVDYLIMESVYGDRNHESRNDRKNLLENVIEDNYKRKGTLIIPTFSLERSQELLFELNDLVENSRIPIMPIFFDSPLAIRLTEIFKQFKNYFNETAQKVLSEDKYLFDFPGLHSTLRSEESKMINDTPNPKIVIAGSGMSSGGRIVHHERHYLPDPNNTILLTGYQSLGSLGRLIQEGVKRVHISGEEVNIQAHVVTILGYSGHKDGDGLYSFVEDMQDKVKKVFVVMGEPKSSMFLVQRIRDNLGIEASAPQKGDSVLLSF
ncbi:MBL fold hydrolase [Candidatus Nomurabacteria bacterium CG_4_9_14_0_2_um_filter_32_10]|uniref:MBL fold hydrolase n=3 Tax=Candidatus Nomuraibacteriota TaxID=1752729 RepID=A0A2H0CIK7_9BACT|nr:MAG: MBL fold hydrolase [Candidatus Nomurabacteria bacterium CG22_combo_CG10-13_8_21_14_all_32_8]PIZ86420.1 MAG: MBL fold hydrolase [Candidatus Nomurabacteria bacterium CG_4_10_14_0_2_um_filter_33_9]PJC49531.1 MAG: MBL fold hydrolase [Candidatus Nomurabacteria bacterium CG_4_9_14_0_2_um_filter_32_10]